MKTLWKYKILKSLLALNNNTKIYITNNREKSRKRAIQEKACMQFTKKVV